MDGSTNNKEPVEFVLRESPPVAGVADLGANMIENVTIGFKCLNKNGTYQWAPSVETKLRKCDLRNARSFSVPCLSDPTFFLAWKGGLLDFILHLYGFCSLLHSIVGIPLWTLLGWNPCDCRYICVAHFCSQCLT